MPPGTRDRRDGVARRSPSKLEARQPGDVLGRRARSPAPPAAPASTRPGRRAHARRASRAAPATALDRPLDLAPRPPRRRSAASALAAALRRRAGPSVAGQVGPDLLGDERDHRMGERERLGEHVSSVAAASPRVAVVEARLDQLEVPVAQLAVDEVVERRARRGGSRSPRCASAMASIARCRRERIQRSSTVRGRAAGSARRRRRRRSSTSRDAFNSLLASWLALGDLLRADSARPASRTSPAGRSARASAP